MLYIYFIANNFLTNNERPILSSGGGRKRIVCEASFLLTKKYEARGGECGFIV
jgi:hypothetical protein